jgi:hypothetical protein
MREGHKALNHRTHVRLPREQIPREGRGCRFQESNLHRLLAHRQGVPTELDSVLEVINHVSADQHPHFLLVHQYNFHHAFLAFHTTTQVKMFSILIFIPLKMDPREHSFETYLT